MRVLVSSDWHLAPATASLVWETIRQLREYASDHGADALVVAGDLLEQARSLDGGLLLGLWRSLLDFPGEVYVLQGNHDQLVRGDWESSPLSLLVGDNIRVIDCPVFTPLGLMVPYTDPRRWTQIVMDSLREEPGSMPQVTWAHQGFKGAYQTAMRRDPDGLTSPSGLRTTITGHYHMPQNLGPLLYCGSPYQTSHAESGQDKSFLVFDDLKPGTGTPLPRRVAFSPIGPRYWTVNWTPGDGEPVRPAGYREGDIVRVVTQASRADLRQSDAVKQLRRAGLDRAAIVARPSIRTARPAAPAGASSTAEVARSYLINVHGPDERTPDPHDVIAFAEERDLWPV